MDQNEVNISEEARTVGDGMENIPIKHELNRIKMNLSKTPSNIFLKSFKPVEPNGPKINLIPKYAPKQRKLPKYLTKKHKEPKFIPYEPYKGAVQPIQPPKPIKQTQYKTKPSKNNVEIQQLVQQMSEIRVAEMNQAKIAALQEHEIIPKQEWEKQKENYENDIKNLRATNAHLENQIKFQAQVNSELKTLLVAAVGEDLETRVQHLTEDKLSLARALLNSADHLTSHQEQTEWLSGQCEVWRSKFLASSLMVEELARWKSALTNRLREAQEIVKQLLAERNTAQKQLLTTYSYLRHISEKTTNKRHDLRSVNILELSNVNEELADTLFEVMNVQKIDVKKQDRCDLPQNTVGEKNALQFLQTPVSITNKQDALCNALMDAASTLGGEQKFLQNPRCCSHCKGETIDI